MGVHTVRLMDGELADSELAEKMADEARERPDVQRWIRRLRRLMKDMPEGLGMFVGESVAVMVLGPNGEHFMTKHGSSDQAAVVESFNDGRWEGGAW